MTNLDRQRKTMFSESEARTEQATRFYELLKERGEIKSHLAVTYRCPRLCTLAQVLPTKAGIIVHRPGYKHSPKVNEATSNAAGRARNTLDGDRRWTADTFMLQDAANLVVNCDHVLDVIIDRETLVADAAARPGEVIITN